MRSFNFLLFILLCRFTRSELHKKNERRQSKIYHQSRFFFCVVNEIIHTCCSCYLSQSQVSACLWTKNRPFLTLIEYLYRFGRIITDKPHCMSLTDAFSFENWKKKKFILYWTILCAGYLEKSNLKEIKSNM